MQAAERVEIRVLSGRSFEERPPQPPPTAAPGGGDRPAEAAEHVRAIAEVLAVGQQAAQPAPDTGTPADPSRWTLAPRAWRRLCTYGVESACEAVLLGVSLHLASRLMSEPAFFMYYLSLPCSVLVLRVFLLVKLVWALDRVSNFLARASTPDEARMTGLRLRHGQSSTAGCWLCLAALLAIVSAVQMVWYGFWLLLMLTYDGDESEREYTLVLGLLAVVGFVGNGGLWWDCARFVKSVPDMPQDSIAILISRARATAAERKESRRTTWQAAVRFSSFRTLTAEAAEAVVQPVDCAVGDEVSCKKQNRRFDLPASCVICLEDFSSNDVVAQLACGHVFHPTCVGRWLDEDGRCPFHCHSSADEVVDGPRRLQVSAASDVPAMEPIAPAPPLFMPV